jgi:hypothetical protein
MSLVLLRLVQNSPHFKERLTTIVGNTGKLSSKDIGGVVAGVVGGLALVGAIAVLFVLSRRKRGEINDDGNNRAEIYDETQNSDRQYPKNVGDTLASGNLQEKRIVPEYLGNEN